MQVPRRATMVRPFGGNPLAAGVAAEALEILFDEDLVGTFGDAGAGVAAPPARHRRPASAHPGHPAVACSPASRSMPAGPTPANWHGPAGPRRADQGHARHGAAYCAAADDQPRGTGMGLARIEEVFADAERKLASAPRGLSIPPDKR